MTEVPAFLDGDDLCRDCGQCCRDITGLRVTEAELVRVPLLAPFVVEQQEHFAILEVPGACPYLDDAGRCSTFETRPFDCSLYPINVLDVVHVDTIGVRDPDGHVRATWHFGAGDCPHRMEFVDLARSQDLEPLRAWVADATGAARVTLHIASRDRLRAAVTTRLHRLGVLERLRTLLGRAPRPAAPGAGSERLDP
jgi:hypothetical protein